MILGNDFEFSKEDYNEIHDLILSKLQNVSDEYTIAEVALGLHHLIFDVLYDIEAGDCLVSNTTGWRAELNLVTKEKYWQKPTYETIRMALEDAEFLCCEGTMNDENVKLAMPRIGCGLDKLEWSKVKAIIAEVFVDTDVEILVCVK